MRSIGAFFIVALIVTLVNEFAFYLWWKLSPLWGMHASLWLLGWIVGVNLATVFAILWLYETKVISLILVTSGSWIEIVKDLYSQLDNLERWLVKTMQDMSSQLTSADPLVKTVTKRIDEMTGTISERLSNVVRNRLNYLEAEMDEKLSEAHRIWFRALPFAEELQALPENERCKALNLWFEGLQGDQEKWRQLAEYFRKRSRK